MKYFTFSLILNHTKIDANIEDKLYEVGCDDALLGVEDGITYLDFTREADSFNSAISSAIQQVDSVLDTGSISRIEPDELVTLSEIGKRVGRSRESIRLLASGQRGQGNFPIPLRGARLRHRIWRWSEVAPWLIGHGVKVGKFDLEQAASIANINAILQIRKSQPLQGAELLRTELR
ncbi:MAG: hypothetical protein KAI81_07590 [Candidatus Marinimicrobia bacterium]|nr:hypothetical protein [Candidatus Neomarinimicrobiota bacterium]